jgi:replication initiation and membrane attachment protein
MDNEALKLSDKYEIRLDSVLSSYDRKILTRLYQPIAGFGAISLFFTLWSEFEGDQTFSTKSNLHERLFDIMQCTTYQFIEFRRKLEALGLLNTLVKTSGEVQSYLYILKAPLDPKKFFAHPLLDVLLRKYLKEYEYEKTKTCFIKVEKSETGYANISATSNEIFVFDQDSQVVESNEKIIGKNEGKPRINFDFETFYMGLREYMIPLSLITDKLKDEIAAISSVYKISAYEMRNIVSQSVSITNTNEKFIDSKKLRINAENYASTYLNSQTLRPVEVEKPYISGSGKMANKIALFNDLTPLEFLSIKNNGMPPLAQDAYIIDALHEKTNLSDPVINVLLDYSLIVNNNSLPRAYIMKIAGSLMRSKVTTAYEAMIYFNDYGKKTISSSNVYEVEESKNMVEEPIKNNENIKGEGFQAFMDFVKQGEKNGKG